jgi:hypothetical protein
MKEVYTDFINRRVSAAITIVIRSYTGSDPKLLLSSKGSQAFHVRGPDELLPDSARENEQKYVQTVGRIILRLKITEKFD